MKVKIWGLGTIAMLLFVSTAMAQQTEPRRQPAREANVSSSGAERATVEQVASMLALANHAEVELAELAIQKTQNDRVRQLAEHMKEDHSKLLAKLKQFTPQIDETQKTARAEAETAGTAERETARTARHDSPHHSQLMRLHVRAAKMKLKMTKDLLSKYEGQDFDMGYLGQQTVAHVDMLAHLHAVKEIGPPEFQQLVAEGIESTNSHLEHVLKLSHNLEDKERGTQ